MIEQPKWVKVIRARWPKSFADEEGWGEVFNADLGEWTPEEITAAAAWMQGPDQNWKIGGENGAKQFVIGVWKYRKMLREESEPPRPACTYCRDGWLDAYPEIDVRDYETADDLHDAQMAAAVESTPCQCDAGRYIMAHFRPYAKTANSDGMSPDEIAVVEQKTRRTYEQTAIERRMEIQNENA